MMKDKKEISFSKFIKSTNGDNFLDTDETMMSYISDSKRADDTTQTYISHWGSDECMFLQSCGFEFIFV